jgi:hypothetical protein
MSIPLDTEGLNVREKLSAERAEQLRSCKIPSLESLNYMSRDHLRGEQDHPLRYLAQHLAKRLKGRRVSPRMLCETALEFTEGLEESVRITIESDRSGHYDSSAVLLSRMAHATYVEIRDIAGDLFSPQFAQTVRRNYENIQNEYRAARKTAATR